MPSDFPPIEHLSDVIERYLTKLSTLKPEMLDRLWSIIEKALEVFHNLPSDFESDESPLSEAEDVITAKSSSSENTDIDEEKNDISVPGPSRISKVTWKNKASVKTPEISLLLNKVDPQMK
ncbi:uncharacterized protein TNIN_4871 [Trichonephila inaurata madagascariensis]|uniref:Uncharacterized protein n=1 Tax=Trichonephila inaurata madagascariensis TaxID=2747483 RepID=A0A8X7C265_9ARAC|nr:uncharacterized protein TNIN_4871 [Trichonephila inaurata madagascariensis]